MTDTFTSAVFDVLIRNKFLRKCITEGIDVLYINDAVFKQSHSTHSYPSELLLRSLVSLLRPRFVQGIWGTQLPPYLIHECHIEDRFE